MRFLVLLLCVSVAAAFPPVQNSSGFFEAEMKRAAAVNVTERSTGTAQSSDSSYSSGLSGGELTCAQALVSQMVSSGINDVSQLYSSGLTISDSTCDTCGKARYCPVDSGSYTNLNPDLFDCVSGGTSSNGVTYCTVKPSGGLIAMVVILPVFGLSVCIAACCYCCRCCPVYKKRHPADPQFVVVQPGIVMNPMAVPVPMPATSK